MAKICEDFDRLDTERSTLLDRKREHARFTLPWILPPQGRTMNTPLDVPYNMEVADGVNNLASRIMSVVWPLNGQSVFEIMLEKEINPSGEDVSDLEKALHLLERRVMATLEPTNLRAAATLVEKHLLVVGDCLIVFDEELSFRVLRFDQFVVERKHEGTWVRVIWREYINAEHYPEFSGISKKSATIQTSPTGGQDKVEPLYTSVRREADGSFLLTQEFRGTMVFTKTYPVAPCSPCRWGSVSGEPYSISLVEDSFGDIRAIDSLTKSLIDTALANAEHRFGVDPTGITEIQDLIDSENGDYVAARQGEVFPIQMQNHPQQQGTMQAVEYFTQKLGRRFLRNLSAQPQGERVTARQIQVIAQELQGSLGGTLSNSASEQQEPVIRWVLYRMSAEGRIPEVLSALVNEKRLLKLRMRAGLEILHREASKERLEEALSKMSALPPQALRVFKWDQIARDWWDHMGLESAGRVKSSEELQAEDEAAMQQQMQALQAETLSKVAVKSA